MKQIETINLPRLHADEVLGFLMLIAEKTKLVTVAADQEVINALATTSQAFVEVLKPTATNSFTAARKAADAVTDHYCVGIRMYAEALTYSPIKEVQVIAEKVFATIKKYGNLSRMGYKEQYPNLKSLLSELKALPTADIDTMGLAVWTDALTQAYDTFTALTEEKTNEDAHKQVGIAQESRNAAEKAYTALVMRINAGAMYMGDEAYAEFIDTANAIIAEYKALIAARKTRSENQ